MEQSRNYQIRIFYVFKFIYSKSFYFLSGDTELGVRIGSRHMSSVETYLDKNI